MEEIYFPKLLVKKRDLIKSELLKLSIDSLEISGKGVKFRVVFRNEDDNEIFEIRTPKLYGGNEVTVQNVRIVLNAEDLEC